MIYFKSRYLAEKLDLNLAKWKRWAREFLDPDPLGGYQSGFARQFSFKEAFRVYLGGHLVGALGLTIPQARQILSGLHPWMKKNQVYAWPKPNGASNQRLSRRVYIYDLEQDNGYGFAVRYLTQPVLPVADGLHEERFALELIGLSYERFAAGGFTHARMIDVDELHDRFLKRVEGE